MSNFLYIKEWLAWIAHGTTCLGELPLNKTYMCTVKSVDKVEYYNLNTVRIQCRVE